MATSKLGERADECGILARLFLKAAKHMERAEKSWRKGAQGEEEVAKRLRGLSSDYQVFNSVMLPNDKGDIDHVVVGPNGVFVIETKNNGGYLRCVGDDWTRRSEGGRMFYPLTSPSKQAKRKAARLQKFIKNNCGLNVFVGSIVCLVGHPELEISRPTVSVVCPEKLCATIKNHSAKGKLTLRQMTKISSAIEPYAYRNQRMSKFTPEIQGMLFKLLIRLPRRSPNYLRRVLGGRL